VHSYSCPTQNRTLRPCREQYGADRGRGKHIPGLVVEQLNG
jgi:hypothetical protein